MKIDISRQVILRLSCLLLGVAPLGGQAATSSRPNVIMFVVDDMNDWVSPLGYAQVKTPHLDRLAQQGVVFKNAHAPSVYCAPSRTAIFSGLSPATTGCYGIEVFYHDYPEIVSLQMAFQAGGYRTYGAGKLFHHRSGYVDLRGWDQYFTRSQEVRDLGYEMNSYYMADAPLPEPFPYSPYYRGTNRDGNAALHLEWGPIANEREEDMVDTIRTNWICDQLATAQDEPFFMAVGMYTPHYPNYAPQKYFDLYDRDALELPPYRADDLDDLPPALQKQMNNRAGQHEELKQLGALQDALHGYLASISFADAMLGRVMAALESSPHRDNTIVIFWSDQGFHHGEKMHWGKHTLWQRTTRVPFIWAGPGIPAGGSIDATVSLIDMYPTLAELCALPTDRTFDGVSLAATLEDPPRATDRNVVIPHADRGSYAVVNRNWRYIHYHDGTEELYNVVEDPNEWFNLAGRDEFAPIIRELKQSAPDHFAPEATSPKALRLVVEGDNFHWEKK